MLLKSGKKRATGGLKREKKNSGGVWLLRGFFLWPVVVFYMCEWSERGFEDDVCIRTRLFFTGKRVRGYEAFYVAGLSVSYFHI